MYTLKHELYPNKAVNKKVEKKLKFNFIQLERASFVRISWRILWTVLFSLSVRCFKSPCDHNLYLSHVCAQSVSHVQLFVTPWIVACRLLGPWAFTRQEYWSGLPCPPPGDLPDSGIEPRSPALQEPPGKPKKTGVSSLFLLQGNFLTQELNQGSPMMQADSLPGELCGQITNNLHRENSHHCVS